MRTLVVLEIEGVLDVNSRAVGLAKKALRDLSYEIAFITKRPSTRAAETLAFLNERIKTGQAPKTAATHWCGRDSNQKTITAKVQTFQALLRQFPTVERVVCFDPDDTVLSQYDLSIRGRQNPRSYTLYRVSGKEAVAAYGSAVFSKREPSEF